MQKKLKKIEKIFKKIWYSLLVLLNNKSDDLFTEKHNRILQMLDDKDQSDKDQDVNMD